MTLSRRQALWGLAAAALSGATDHLAAQAGAAGARTVQRWNVADQRLVPPGAAGTDIVHAGADRVGLLRPGQAEPVWQTTHGLSGPAVFRPRADTRQVLVGSLRSLASWQLADGAVNWRRQATLQFGTPCLDRGRVYLGDGHALQALDAQNGNLLWRVDTTPDTLMSYAPTVVGDRVLVGPGNGRLYAVDRDDGRTIWTLDLADEWQYLRQLHVGANVLVAGSYKELLYGIAIDSGRVLWKFNAGNFINSHHVSGQTAFLWSPTGWIFALDVATGALRWRHRTTAYDGRSGAWASVLAELASDDQHLYALDMGHVVHVLDRHSGDEITRFKVDTALRPALLVHADRRIVLASDAGEIVQMAT
ncbi:PQQ-binding-like beta-propeller repeat protein [Sphaerotilus mobilis]|uniref:outer membrane protein assembly factor BamB family protein n=1 Tax=Sphaerotilus mobilis TaxID=47994 RepID=UPI0013EE5713|nr:PQQ-binding-like beta-propeller repeat protein [Sphaerotilus mobilis]